MFYVQRVVDWDSQGAKNIQLCQACGTESTNVDARVSPKVRFFIFNELYELEEMLAVMFKLAN